MKLTRVTLVTAVAILVAVGCRQPSSTIVHPEEPLAPPPERLQELRLDPVPEAIEALKMLLADPLSAEPRRSLHDIYRDRGYNAAAEFFATTADVLNGRESEFNPVGPRTGWIYEGSESRRSEDLLAVFQAQQTAMAGGGRVAAEEIEGSIRDHGLSTDLAGAWASSVLWWAAVDPGEVPEEKLEVSLRLFLTIVEETPVTPVQGGGKWQSYQVLGDILRTLGDPASAYVASSLSRNYLDLANPQLSDAAQNRQSSRHAETRADLEEALGISVPPVTLPPVP